MCKGGWGKFPLHTSLEVDRSPLYGAHFNLQTAQREQEDRARMGSWRGLSTHSGESLMAAPRWRLLFHVSSCQSRWLLRYLWRFSAPPCFFLSSSPYKVSCCCNVLTFYYKGPKSRRKRRQVFTKHRHHATDRLFCNRSSGSVYFQNGKW